MPIIATNAELHLINENLTTKDIKAAKLIEEVTTKHNFLFFYNKISGNLLNHNVDRLSYYSKSGHYEGKYLQKNKRKMEYQMFFDILTSNLCPEIIVVMHHDDAHANYDKLFDYLKFLCKSNPELTKRVEQINAERARKKNAFVDAIRKVKEKKNKS